MQHITSVRGAGVQFVKKLISDKSFRREQSLLAAEGERIIADLPPSVHIRTLYVLEDKAEKFAKYAAAAEEVIYCTDNVMRAISSASTPAGIVAVADKPVSVKTGEELIVLDGITDPGNMGTIVRTACACGVRDILCLDCCDPFSPKVIRASMGGIFRVNIVEAAREEAEKYLREYKIFALDMQGENVYNIEKKEFTGRYAIAVGSEAFGLSPKLRAAAYKTVSLPMSGEMESLNAAISLSIVLYTVKYALK